MDVSGKINFLAVCVICILEFSSAFDNEPYAHHTHHQENSSNSSLSQTQELSTALRSGEMEEVRNLIKAGVLEEYLEGKDKDERKKTIEKIYSKIRTVELLLLTGIATVSNQENDLGTPLDKSSFKMTLIPGTDFYTGLKVNVSTVKSWGKLHVKDGKKPLHIICQLPDVDPETVKIILENGKDNINVKTDLNATPLIFATSNSNFELVKFLVENGANINDYASVSVDTEDRGDHYPYMKIFSKKKVFIPKTIFHYSPLVAAVFEGNERVLNYLIEKGADVQVDRQSWAALFHPVILEKRNILEILLQNRIDVTSRDMLGSTALHRSAKKGNVEIAKLLLKHGADVNGTDNFGWTPLHIASFFSTEAGKPMIDLLVESKSNIHAKTDGGYFPLNLAVAGGNLDFLKYLIEKFDTLNAIGQHVDLPESDSDQDHTKMIDILINYGASFNQQDDILRWSPLHWAAASGDLSVAKLLVKYGAVVSTRSTMGLNPYKTAERFGRKAVADFLSTVKDLVR